MWTGLDERRYVCVKKYQKESLVTPLPETGRRTDSDNTMQDSNLHLQFTNVFADYYLSRIRPMMLRISKNTYEKDLLPE